MTRGRRPSESFPELVYDEEEKTDPNPVPPGAPRSRLTTPSRALEGLPGFEPGREVGRREGRREGVIAACERFLEGWLSNPKNDVGVAHLLAARIARECGVELAPLPGARRPAPAPARAPAGLPPPLPAGKRGT